MRRMVVPPYRVARAVKKAGASPRAAEFGFGVVASVLTVEETGLGYPQVTVYLNGNVATPVPARYSAAYTPTVNDQVLMGLIGGDARTKQQWAVIYAFA